MADNLRTESGSTTKIGNVNHSCDIIKDRVDISVLYAIADEKSFLGDLEIDAVIGKNH